MPWRLCFVVYTHSTFWLMLQESSHVVDYKYQRTTRVAHSQRLKMNIEQNKTVRSYFTCSLSSLLGFWVVLEPFRLLLLCFFSSTFFLLPLLERERKSRNLGSKTTRKPRRDDNEQVKYDFIFVLFSSIFIFNLWEWVTCENELRPWICSQCVRFSR